MIPALRRRLMATAGEKRWRRSALRAFGAALLLAFPAIGVGTVEAAGLFSADDGAVPLRQAPGRLPDESLFPEGGLRGEAPGELSPSMELRSRIAAIDFGQLAAARSEVARGRPSNLRLNLFKDAEFEAVIERTEPTSTGHTLTGRLADDPLSTVVLAVNGDHIAGTVWSPHGTHDIRTLGAGPAVIRQLDPAALGRCGVGKAPPPVRPDASPAPWAFGSPPARHSYADASAPQAALRAENAASPDDGSLIDVLVVYTANIRILHGGHRAMRAMIDRDVAMTNEAYRESGAVQKIALVGAVEVDYPWDITGRSSFLTLFNRLGSKEDGYFEEVHALRDRYAADLVLLHVGDLSDGQGGAISDTGGIANVPYSPAGNDEVAFSIASSSAFAHELGHSMGLLHERQLDLSNEPFPYSHGFRAPCLNADDHEICEIKTVMAARPPRLLRFSNPGQKWPDESGVPLGVPGDEPSDRVDGPADAVRSLNEMRRAIANYRPSAERCAYALSPERPVLPAAGGEFRLRVEAAPGCEWSARSDGGFLSIAEGSKGVGGGEVVYRAPENPGWDREAALLVAAEVYLVRQEGDRPITPVCERTLEVSEAIAAALDKPCAEISGTDLASVGALRVALPRGGAPKLDPGDFSGLSGLGWLSIDPDWVRDERPSLRLAPDLFDGLSRLRHLSLYGNAISTLPPGLFKDLSELNSLNLSQNQLAELAPGVFEGLGNLRFLHLQHNDLSRLSLGLFDGLTNLWQLNLHENRLTTLPLGLFDGLSELRNLNISDNSLTALESGLFDELELLSRLSISHNQLTELEPGLFDGLGVRESLDLLLGGNRLRVLPADLFDGILHMGMLNLSGNQLAALPPSLFAGLPLNKLSLDGNRLAGLPNGLFAGLTNLETLNLSGNPGAPFALTLELVALPAANSSQGRSAAIAAEVASGVPFDVRAGISASGGVLSAHSTLIEAGQIKGERISVIPKSEGPVTVELDAVSGLLKEWECDNFVNAVAFNQLCYLGIRTAAGAPLVLYGLPDQTLTPDSVVKFHLPSAFPNFGAGTSYEVESSNPAAVATMIREGLLIVSAAGDGETTLTVTAISPDGRRETRRFEVKVEPALRSRWGGWRSVLLRPPSSLRQGQDGPAPKTDRSGTP